MMQARIDRMDELGQMIVKTSAILGMSFARRMLDTMLPKKITATMVQRCMRQIADEQIFACALLAENQATAAAEHVSAVQQRGAQFLCHCPRSTAQAQKERTINDCQTLCFKSSLLQETAYEMYTESLRRKIHIKAARYLEAQAHKCSACGGGDFIPATQSLPSQTMPPENLELLEVRRRSQRTSTGGPPQVRNPISKLRKTSLALGATATAAGAAAAAAATGDGAETTQSASQEQTAALGDLPEQISSPELYSPEHGKYRHYAFLCSF